MGCNTSSPEMAVVPDQKDNSTKENNEGEVPDDEETKHNNESNSAAKTASLRSENGGEQEEPAKQAAEIYVVDEEEAATKIQAAFRGHRARKNADNMITDNKSDEPTQQELEEEFRADDVELCKAATKIQASFRGHMSRKTGEGDQGDKPGDADKQGGVPEEELDIDLTDPELSKAAVKIQASFRGHMSRKDNDGKEF